MPMKLGSELPSLEGASEWVNGEVAADDLKGVPVLVHFWSVSCYLCKKNLPTLQEWKGMYGEKGLKVVGIHMPRQPEDMDQAQVMDAIASLSITEPCAVDNAHALKKAFQNDQGWVPAYFLFDAEGKLKSRTAGEAGLTMLKGALDRLLLDAAA